MNHCLNIYKVNINNCSLETFLESNINNTINQLNNS